MDANEIKVNRVAKKVSVQRQNKPEGKKPIRHDNHLRDFFFIPIGIRTAMSHTRNIGEFNSIGCLLRINLEETLLFCFFSLSNLGRPARTRIANPLCELRVIPSSTETMKIKMKKSNTTEKLSYT